MAQGPLFSGPSFPNEASVFDGQGIPDVFETAIGSSVSKVGECVHVIGVGDVLRTSSILPFHVRWNPTVILPCEWNIVRTSDFVEMSTSAQFKSHRYTLTKRVKLDNAGFTITASLHNTGTVPIPVRWFVHPFFPLIDGTVFCELSLPLKIPDNPGFEYTGKRITMVKTFDWQSGCYRTLCVPWDNPVSISVKHPKVNCISLRTSYGLSWLPVWANANTFSIEPFFSRLLIPGESAEWDIVFTIL